MYRRYVVIPQSIGNLAAALALFIASIAYATFPFSFFQFSVLITIFVV